MTYELALAVADRMNELKVPQLPEIEHAVDEWTERGGRMVVWNLPDGGWRIDITVIGREGRV